MQTDGWLSEQSAKVYEVSTETLFLGRQDAMQRQTLVPLAKWMSGRPASGRGVRALEVAAGTGRFATFMKVVNVSWLAILMGLPTPTGMVGAKQGKQMLWHLRAATERESRCVNSTWMCVEARRLLHAFC